MLNVIKVTNDILIRKSNHLNRIIIMTCAIMVITMEIGELFQDTGVIRFL